VRKQQHIEPPQIAAGRERDADAVPSWPGFEIGGGEMVHHKPHDKRKSAGQADRAQKNEKDVGQCFSCASRHPQFRNLNCSL